MMKSIGMITVGLYRGGDTPELVCPEHPEWYAEIDGLGLALIVRIAEEHLRQDHRVHVPQCLCREPRVADGRCFPA